MVIGANDVVNPAARNQANSPIYGMPILNVDESKTTVVLKRSMATGFAGVDNPLFYKPNTLMLFGDARQSIASLVAEVRRQ
jgi:NAD(P) transhydrogenase subunit beta